VLKAHQITRFFLLTIYPRTKNNLPLKAFKENASIKHTTGKRFFNKKPGKNPGINKNGVSMEKLFSEGKLFLERVFIVNVFPK